uniref:Uncharacterized protein n=1 Tax=Physcomitrium patens TaxID=3218 RepID=A0A2K1ICP9_PHYPA|nr:hypothetical protein PHYPA_030530 [Physcomitrium patens]
MEKASGNPDLLIASQEAWISDSSGTLRLQTRRYLSKGSGLGFASELGLARLWSRSFTIFDNHFGFWRTILILF